MSCTDYVESARTDLEVLVVDTSLGVDHVRERLTQKLAYLKTQGCGYLYARSKTNHMGGTICILGGTIPGATKRALRDIFRFPAPPMSTAHHPPAS